MTESRVRKAFTGDHVLNYDRKSQKANWLDPQIVFGLAYEHVNPGESILDVGIGTGLSSYLFHRAGLDVAGMDFSTEMLAVCREKGFASRLVEHDVSVAPYPFDGGSVHHAVCTGVTHLFPELDIMFHEVARIMKSGGVFVFVVALRNDDEPVAQAVGGHDGCPCPGRGVFYCHSPAVLEVLSGRCGFAPVTSLRFMSASIGGRERSYQACVVRKS
jgi:SAM-dependent methyltransferase